MAYNPNIPAPINRVQDDIAAMRDNFQHLAPLAQAVGELQAVSELAPVAGELQTVSELAPYVQAILDSRIVEMGSNANGTYVRWENGLQVCWLTKNFGVSVDSEYGALYVSPLLTWIFPAAFVSAPTVSGLGYYGSSNAPRWVGVGRGVTATNVSFWILDAFPRSSTDHGVQLVAIGWWK